MSNGATEYKRIILLLIAYVSVQQESLEKNMGIQNQTVIMMLVIIVVLIVNRGFFALANLPCIIV